MKYIRAITFVIVVTWILYSCKKEYSQEGGVIPPIDTSGQNCKIENIVEADHSTGTAEYAYSSTYDAGHKVSMIELVDSLSNFVDNTFPVSYPAGKIQVDANQYFITGTDGKVTEFHGYEFPEDNTSDRFTVKYTYNSAGQLVKRAEEYDLFPGVTSFEMDYTYTGSNLTRAEIKANNGTTLQTFLDVAYGYETTKTIKNFICLNAVAPEIFYFQTAINIGVASVNPVNKVTTTFVKYNNGQDSTTVCNFVNYTYDTKNQVTSFELTGGDFVLNNLYAGKKYNISYACY